MNGKKDILPIVIAFFIALTITVIVRLFIPVGVISGSQQNSKKELSMPDIPLMPKKIEKKKEDQVLVVSKDIKKDSKITLNNLVWKKWPEDAMQRYFIAKDEHGNALNNGADYNNALKMWAASDIPAGVPLTTHMLTNEDPKKKMEEEKKKRIEKQRIREKEEKSAFIKKGMRAVTFLIDQKSASSSAMLSPGDLVDIIIMEQRNDRIKIHKYKALKILAIDGMTKFENKKDKNSDGSLFEGLSSVGGLLSHKNVTLEVKEKLVEQMLKQAGNNGVILSLRSQAEKTKDAGEEVEDSEESSVKDSLLQNIVDVNHVNSIEALETVKKRKMIEEENLSMLINNMNSVGGAKNPADALIEANNKKLENSGKYEIVSGKIVGEEKEEPEEKSVVIYRKLKTDEIQFDQDGNKVDASKKSSSPSSRKSAPGGMES